MKLTPFTPFDPSTLPRRHPGTTPRALQAEPIYSWQDMARIEPGLAKLLEEAQAVKDLGGQSFCANAVWYGTPQTKGLKRQLERLVGWGARNPALRTMQAYDVAYEKIYEVLPYCRNCCCW